MLEFFFRMSSTLRPLRKGMVLMIVLFALLAVYGFFRSGITPSPVLQLGLSGSLFSALLLSTTDIFRNVPPPAAPDARWWLRVKRKSVRGFYTAIAILVMLSGLVLVGTSFRLFSV